MNMKIILLAIALAAHAEAPKAGLASVAAAPAAVAATQTVVEVPVVQEARAADPRLYGAQTFPAVTSGWINNLSLAAEAEACSLSALLRTRFLSGPWSAARRLEAARLRGDREEVRRMESALDALVDEATALE